MAAVDDGLVDSPFGRVRPEILDILNGGQGAPAPVAEQPVQPAPTNEVAPVAAPAVPGVDSRLNVAAQQEPVDPNTFSAAVGRGAGGLKTAVGGAAEVAGTLFNSAAVKDWGEEVRVAGKDYAEQFGTPEYGSSADITDPFDMDQVGQFLKNQAGQIAPQIAVIGSAGAAASKLPGVAGLMGKGAAAAAGTFLTSFGLNTGNIQAELKQLDPQGNHPMTALAFGAGAGVLDSVGFGLMAKPLLKYLGPEQIYMHAIASGIPQKTALDGIKSAMTGATIGAVTNSVIDAGQAVVAGEATGQEYTPEQIMHRAVDSAFGGAIGGGVVRGGGEILDRVIQNSTTPGSAVDPSSGLKSSKEHGILNKIVDQTMREATAPLDPLAQVSPEFQSLIRDFRPDMTGQKATGETVHERYEILSGKLHTDMDSILRSKSDDEKAAILKDFENPVPTDPDAIALRNTFDEVWNLADKAGLEVGKQEGYAPYTLNTEAIRSNRGEFEADLTRAGYQNPTQMVDEFLQQQDNPREYDAAPKVEHLVQPNMTQPQLLEIMKRFTMGGDPDTMRGKFAQGPGVPPKNSNLEFQRAFADLPQAVRSKWSEEQSVKDRVGAFNDYLHGAAHRIAYAERFGPSGEKLNARVAKGVYEAQQAGRNPTKGEIDQIYGVADAYNGVYRRIKSQDVRKAMAIGGAAINIKTLPFAAIMSLTEFATPMIRFNIADTLGAVAPMMYEVTHGMMSAAFKKVPRSEWAKLAGEAGVDWASTQNLVGERLGSTEYHRGAAKANRMFFLANGLSALTHAQRTLGGLTGQRVYKSNLQLLAAGLDMTSARGSKALNELRSLGVDVRNRNEAQALYSPVTPAEVARAREVERLMVRRASTQSVLEPTSSDLPLWMSNGYAAPLAQLKRYPTAYSNIILPQLLRRMKPSYQGSYTGAVTATIGTAFILGLMYQLGTVQDYLSKYAKAGFTEPEDDRTEGQKAFDVVNRTFLPMTVQYATGMLASDRYGQSPVDSALGPWFGVANDAARAGTRTINSFAEEPTSGYVWQFLYKQTPFGSIKPIQEAVKDNLDLE